MNSNAQEFIQTIKHAVKFKIFLLSKLPAAYFSGIRIKNVDERECSVSVPFKWLTQNPFKSTYFASLAMAAEMSTGVLAMMQVYKRKPKISMLLIHIQASYYKKVTGKATFTCAEGDKIHDAVEEAISKNESQAITVTSVGKNSEGDVVAEFLFTWSFKAKQR